MRQPRVLAEAGRPGLYHVCSRVVDRRVVFYERERRKFLALIKGGATFAGVDVVSWCLMGNHFHLLVRVPSVDADAMSDHEVFSRMEHIYTEPRMRHFRGVWERIGSEEARRDYLAPFRARMGSLSDFVKTLKQRFTQWFNRLNNREGTLWEGRFFSVMLAHNEKENGEGLGLLARFVAGYIDLNPVRAKLVSDAKESGWSSYGAATRGDAEGLAGLRILWGSRATEGLEDEGILAIHGGMLARARFHDGASEGDAPSFRDGGKFVGKHVDDEGETQGESFGGDERRRGLSAKDVERRLLSLMGRRCESLTKGRALGRKWVIDQSG